MSRDFGRRRVEDRTGQPFMTQIEVERELLFGVLASQAGLVGAEAVAEAVAHWRETPGRRLAEVLQERGALTGAESTLIDHLVAMHVARHGESTATAAATATVDLFRDVGPLPPALRSIAESITARATEPQAPEPTLRDGDLGATTEAGTHLGTIVDDYGTKWHDEPTDAATEAGSATRAPEQTRGDVDGTPTSGTPTEPEGASRPGPRHARPDPIPVVASRFRRVRSHARGGLGEVFVAEDQELRRFVALKEIQERHADHEVSRLRFLLEAEVTGKLEHPGIVPIYGLGRYFDGRVYYAMRFIRGESLKDAIRRFHDEPEADPGVRALRLRDLLSRFVDVCNAIHYAHSKGVLHRDIKPGNIMIGKFGETLVVDWGLAKLVGAPEDHQHDADDPLISAGMLSGSTDTLIGSAMGTPQYMSPEQADGKLDELGPACDVYSLGATLYHLLTGKAAFQEPGVAAVLAKVRAGDFLPPDKVLPTVPPALSSICLKAMALRPEARYPTARALADDIEHWLADEPVSAHPESGRDRLLRWGRRHMPVVSGVAALLLTGVLSLAIATGIVSAARAREERQKTLALDNFEIARDGADALLVAVGDVDLADVPEMEPVRRELLERARRSYLRFLDQRGDDPLVRWGAGRALTRLGDIDRILGNNPAARKSYDDAIARLSKLADQYPRVDDYRRDLARALQGLGLLSKTLSRFTEAEGSFRRAIALRSAISPPGRDDREAVAESRYFLGAVLAKLGGRGADDEAAYRSAISAQEELVGGVESGPRSRERLARYLNNLGILQEATGHADDALATFAKALNLYDGADRATLAQPGPRWQWGRLDNNIGAILQSRPGRLDDAEAALRESDALLGGLAAQYPLIPQYRREQASVVSNLGLLESARNHPDKAVEAYRRCVSMLDTLVAESGAVPDDRLRRAVALCDLNVLLVDSDPAGASKAIDAAIADQEGLVREFPDVPDYAGALGRSLYDRGTLALDRGRPAEARRYLELAIPRQRAAVAARPDTRAFKGYLYDALGELSNALIAEGNLDRAADTADELPRVLPDDSRSLADAAALLCRCVEKSGPKADAFAVRAVSLLREAVATRRIADPRLFDRPDFAPIRDRDDFKRLRIEWNATIAPKPG